MCVNVSLATKGRLFEKIVIRRSGTSFLHKKEDKMNIAPSRKQRQHPLPASLQSLYHRALREYASTALATIKPNYWPNHAIVFAIARTLKSRGDHQAVELAEALEQSWAGDGI